MPRLITIYSVIFKILWTEMSSVGDVKSVVGEYFSSQIRSMHTSPAYVILRSYPSEGCHFGPIELGIIFNAAKKYIPGCNGAINVSKRFLLSKILIKSNLSLISTKYELSE